MNRLRIAPNVRRALATGGPVVALESTVIAHGLPFPHNLALAREAEQIVRDSGAVPATVAIADGSLCVGLSDADLEHLAQSGAARKVSTRDIAATVAAGEWGATTVSGTLFAAHRAGIRVFATGGIGGVHRDAPTDVSADLPALASTPIVVVCAGAKAILDLPNTLEWLETHGVPVLGWGTERFPAFFSRDSGLTLDRSVDSAEAVAAIARAQWDLELLQALLVCVPVPADAEIPPEPAQRAIATALQAAHDRGLRGKDVTPFLLSTVAELTSGASLSANLALLRQNVRVAAEIAVELARKAPGTKRMI